MVVQIVQVTPLFQYMLLRWNRRRGRITLPILISSYYAWHVSLIQGGKLVLEK